MKPVRLAPLLAITALFSGCWEDFFMRMVDQKKNRPYSKSAVFTDGLAMRHPPEGTISRERNLAMDEGMPPITLAFLQKGKKRYEIVCAACHGLTGESDWRPSGLKETGSIVSTNFVLNPAPTWHSDRLRQKDDAHFYAAISKGFGYMPAFSEIPHEERWAIVAYIRALQLSQRYPYAKLSDEGRAQVDRSKAETAREHL